MDRTPPLRIRFKLLIFTTLVMISLIPVAILTSWVQHTAVEKEIEAVKDKHLIIAGSLSRAFQRYVFDVKSVFGYASQMLSAGEVPVSMSKLLEAMEISSLCIISDKSEYENMSSQSGSCSFKLDDAQLELIKNSVEQVSAPVYMSNLIHLNSRPVFLLAKRIEQDSIVVATLETTYVIQSQQSIEFGEKGHSMVVDAVGRVIAHPNSQWQKDSKDTSKISIVQKMMAGETGVDQFYSPALKDNMIAGHTSVAGVGWGVMVPQPHSELIAQAGDVRWAALLVSLVGLTIAVLLGWIVARALARPIESISRTATEIASGNSEARVPDIFRLATLEVRELALSFNRMVDRLGASHADLQQHRDNLEVLVNHRTTELRNQIQIREQVEVVLQRQKEHLDITLASIGEGVIVADKNRNVSFLNPVAEELTGWDLSSAVGQSVNRVLDIKDQFTNNSHDLKPHQRSSSLAGDGLLIRYDRSTVEVQNNIAEIKNEAGEVTGLVIIVRDITETRKLSRRLSYEASHDTLTGMINRRAFEKHLSTIIPFTAEVQDKYCLAYLDLDQFKIVNDACGHVAGDELLCAISGVIKNCIHDNHILARLGGDEFGILYHQCSLTQALEMSELIRKQVEEFRFVHNGQIFHVGVSIGVVEITESNDSLAEIFRAADSACYIAKGRGRNTVHAFHSTDEDAVERAGEMRWARRLQSALEEDRFELHLQPIEPLTNSDKGVSHYEILLRMKDEHDRLIYPGAFLPAAARYDLLPSIDRWVFARSMQWLGDNRDLLKGGRISINLTGVTLSENSFLDFAEQQLKLYDMSAESIIIEITENSALNNLTAALKFMTRLKEQGCQFALDDFGKGFSSFNSLKHLPVDYVKIDGGFVRDMLVDRMDETIVRTINEIGHTMDKLVIVEFVESEEIWDRVRGFGIDYGQGYAIARPGPLKQFDVFKNATEFTIGEDKKFLLG